MKKVEHKFRNSSLPSFELNDEQSRISLNLVNNKLDKGKVKTKSAMSPGRLI